MSTAAVAEVSLPQARPINPWVVAGAVMTTTFMVVLDSTVVNVALPHIAGSLSSSPEEATWSLTSYLVANAIILPATGWLSRMLGRKRLLMACVAVFTLASLACGAAQTLSFLILARIIQGFGGGVMQPISQSILLESFPPRKRGMAMAIFGLGIVVAPIVGPFLGGWITDNMSWRWVFYINLPVGILSLFLVQTFIEDPHYIRAGRATKIDYIGLILLAIWVGSLHVMLDKGQQEDWLSSPLIRALLAASVLGLVAFVYWEFRQDEPIVNLRILHDRNFLTGTVLITVVGAVMYGATVLLPLLLQTVMGYSAVESGLTMTPRGVGSLIGMFVVGRLIGVIDGRFLLPIGFVALGYSTYIFGSLSLQFAPVNVLWPNIINGLAIGFIFVPLTTTAMGTLRNEEVGNAAGIYNLMRNIGAAAGIAMITTFLARGAQVHQNVLVAHMTPYNSVYQQELHAIQSGLTPYSGSYAAARQAEVILNGQMQRQATLGAFMDDFKLLAFLSFICLPAIFFLKRQVHTDHGPPAAAVD